MFALPRTFPFEACRKAGREGSRLIAAGDRPAAIRHRKSYRKLRSVGDFKSTWSHFVRGARAYTCRDGEAKMNIPANGSTSKRRARTWGTRPDFQPFRAGQRRFLLMSKEVCTFVLADGV